MSLNKAGYTLLEMLVTIVLLAIMLLGAFMTLNATRRLALKNVLRDEALAVAKEAMEKQGQGAISRRIRGFVVDYYYQVRNCTGNSTLLPALSLNCKEIEVRWTDPFGEGHELQIYTYR